MKGTYWNHEGALQTLYNNLFARLVPKQGRASTPHGELLRCMSRLYYDLHNNGACNVRDGCYDHEQKILLAFAATVGPRDTREDIRALACGRASPGQAEVAADMVIRHVEYAEWLAALEHDMREEGMLDNHPDK